MDSTLEIKARLPIEELVGQYCQLKKKGRAFVCLCPFHNDTHPSMTISPEKGIAYCFACQTGGDIFSFYQAIENVDFRQSLQDLAEKVGVKLETMKQPSIKKDEKDRLRECLECTLKFYRANLKSSESAQAYLKERQIPPEQLEKFRLGLAPDSFSDTYSHLLKEGFSQSEIIKAGMGIQKEIEGKIYDRFRNRLMFPIADHQGTVIGFGGRTLGEDDAKYINSAESPLYNKSTVLYGLDLAKEATRKTKKVILVEGYFDVLACHRVGVENTVAVSGTALTQQHVKLLKRYAETIVLCLDCDRAGEQAAERAFHLCSAEGLQVHAVSLTEKDPDEAANKQPEAFRTLLTEKSVPYLDAVIEQFKSQDTVSAQGKRDALTRLLPLLQSLSLETEKEHYLTRIAELLQATETALREDLVKLSEEPPSPATPVQSQEKRKEEGFSSVEVALSLFVLHPKFLHLLDDLIPPQEEFAAALCSALKEAGEVKSLSIEALNLSELHRERVQILALYGEHHGFTDWSESLAIREIKRNCAHANRDVLQSKLREIIEKLQDARKEGKSAEEAKFMMQYQQILKLTKMASG